MKTMKLLTFALLLIVISGSCKKDYPKDIPDWLKDRIKEEKKNPSACCLTIDEYVYENNSIYIFHKEGNYEHNVFDKDGNEQCVFLVVPNSTCGSIQNMQDYQANRRIWTQKE